MKIDRSGFLLLTGAIAGTGCIIQTTPPGGGTTTPTPATATTTAAAPTTAPSPTPTTAPPPGGPRHVGTGSLFGNISHDNTGIQNPPPATCLDEGAVATAPACTAAAGAACASGVPGQCNVFGQNFEPKIAADAVTCLSGLSAAQQCDQNQVVTCGTNALRKACPTTQQAAIQACAQVAGVAACATTQADCVALVSGLSQPGVSALESCVFEGGGPCASNNFNACLSKIILSAPTAEGNGCGTVNQSRIHHR